MIKSNTNQVYDVVDFNALHESLREDLMKMAEWKDQQIIEYLYKNIQSLLKDYGVSEASADIATQLFLANFKIAMEE